MSNSFIVSSFISSYMLHQLHASRVQKYFSQIISDRTPTIKPRYD